MTATGKRFFHLSLTSPALGLLEEAEHYFLAGNLNEALAAAQQAWREHPGEPDVFRVLAYIHMARGEYPPAAQAAYQSVLLESANPASYATLAQVYITFNMLGNAEETLRAAQQQFPDDPALLVLRADVAFRLRRDDSGEHLAMQALHLNAGDGYAKALLGAYRLRQKRYPGAESLLREAVEVYPQRWDYLRDYGIALLHQQQYVKAREALTASFRLNSADNSTMQHLVYAQRLSANAGGEGRFPSSFITSSASAGCC